MVPCVLLQLDPDQKNKTIHIQKLHHIPVTAGVKKMTISTDMPNMPKKLNRHSPMPSKNLPMSSNKKTQMDYHHPGPLTTPFNLRTPSPLAAPKHIH